MPACSSHGIGALTELLSTGDIAALYLHDRPSGCLRQLYAWLENSASCKPAAYLNMAGVLAGE